MNNEEEATYLRNLQAEMAHDVSKQQNKEKYEVTTVHDDEITIAETVYGKR